MHINNLGGHERHSKVTTSDPFRPRKRAKSSVDREPSTRIEFLNGKSTLSIRLQAKASNIAGDIDGETTRKLLRIVKQRHLTREFLRREWLQASMSIGSENGCGNESTDE
jgi:hypothetical protein